jgi:hypothetical protein
MRSHFFRVLGCAIGLLAILMISCAPTVSRIVSMQERDASSEMPCDMPSMHHEAHASTDHSHVASSDTDACAYCSLLAHMPAVLSAPIVFALFVRASLQRTAARFESAMLIEPVTPGQPRAPPVL